jgi:uncharacterized protein YggE
MDTGVSVVGTGQVSGTPDVLGIALGVEHLAANVADSIAQVGERTDAVIAALRGQGVAESELRTSSVNVYQEYKGVDPDAPYRASHTISVVTRDLSGFGRLLNAAVDAAGNSLAVHGLEFGIEDKTELLSEARALAFRQARERATELAGLAGFSLGSVTAIQETQSHFPFVAQSASLGGKLDTGINIVPGGQEVQVTLQVQFAWA